MDPKTKRLSKRVLEESIYAYRALQGIQDYNPMKSEFKLDELEKMYKNLESQKSAEAVAESQFKAARDNSVDLEHRFHQLMLSVKDQVRAQFGTSSNEVQSLGLKKKTEYKSPSKK